MKKLAALATIYLSRRISQQSPFLYLSKCVQVRGDQVGKQFKCMDRFQIVDFGGLRVYGTQRSEKRAVIQNDRYGDITSKSIHGRGMVRGIYCIGYNVINNDCHLVLPDFMAYRRLNLQLIANMQSKFYFVEQAQVTQRFSVTRAIAANPIPVLAQITSRSDGTADISAIASMSS